MRNKLIVLVIIIFSFFFIDKVSALSDVPKTTYVLDFNSSSIEKIFDDTNENFYKYYSLDDILNKYYSIIKEHKNEYPYYVIKMVYNSDTFLTFDVSLFNQLPVIRQYGYVNSDKRNIWYGYVTYHYTGTVLNSRETFGHGFPSTLNNLSFSSFSNVNYQSKGDYFNENFSSISSNKTAYAREFIYDSNVNIDKRNVYGSSVDVDFKLDNHYYGDKDIFPFYKDYRNPTITTYTENTIYNDDNELIQLKIHVKWSRKDLSKYQYRFSTQNTTNYKYFFDDSLENEVIVNANDIYTFEILDLDGNIISSQTVNINMISNSVLPTLTLDDFQSPGCYYGEQQICQIMTLYSYNADFSKYTLQYRFNDGEWITHNYENSAKGQIVIYENTTISARLIRNSDNKLIDSASYTITNINPNILTDIPTFKFMKPFCTNMEPGTWHEIGQGNFKQTLRMTIYGLDTTKYRVFVSNDANNFNEINENDFENDRVPLIKYYNFEYYEDTLIIVKITDLDGNYVTGITYNFDFNCNDVDIKLGNINNMNDVFKTVTNFFNKLKDIMLKIKEIIEYFYNLLNSEIRAFILTAFILIIVLNLIMRMMK